MACPVGSCSYAGPPASVAGHVNATDDEAHQWSRLPADGATAFRQRHGAEVVEAGATLACPVEDCDYTGSLGSVRAHVSGRRDDAHESAELHERGRLPLGPDDVVETGANADAGTDPDDGDAGERGGPPSATTVACPVSGCSYEGERASVRAHVSGVHDDDHDWDRLSDEQVAALRDAAGDDAGDGGNGETDGATDGTAGLLDERTVARLETLVSGVRASGVDTASEPTIRDAVNAYVLSSELASVAKRVRGDLRDAILDEVDDDIELTADVGSVRRATRERTTLREAERVFEALDRADVDRSAVTVPRIDPEKVEAVVESGDVAFEDVFERTASSTIRKVDVDGREIPRFGER